MLLPNLYGISIRLKHCLTQYYHRNAATEFKGLLYGNYGGGRGDGFEPGGASYETGFCPHGSRSQM